MAQLCRKRPNWQVLNICYIALVPFTSKNHLISKRSIASHRSMFVNSDYLLSSLMLMAMDEMISCTEYLFAAGNSVLLYYL